MRQYLPRPLVPAQGEAQGPGWDSFIAFGGEVMYYPASYRVFKRAKVMEIRRSVW